MANANGAHLDPLPLSPLLSPSNLPLFPIFRCFSRRRVPRLSQWTPLKSQGRSFASRSIRPSAWSTRARLPSVCVSIALTIFKVPTVGVVYNPIVGELFTGVHGQGAFLNGAPIKASSQTELPSALLATGGGTKRDKPIVDAITGRINNLLFKVNSGSLY
ncbi:hypothetical protein Cni_G01698 [Canna indica]|uniref:Uncharacterized protein n=1 Tax=Canna indica TaxID=4628 RepID=A0AAQ3JN93_9LILI|nr:hypothetical protein Cni_G01698 [Canna indica]